MEKEQYYSFTVSKKDKGSRLDKVMASRICELSRSRIQNLIEESCVLRNKTVVDDCSCKVKEGDEIEVNMPENKPSQMMATEIPLNIVYEDDEFLVIDKQAGLTVHPGAGNHSDTLANALLAHCKGRLSGIGGVERPGIVHRLDKDTSGLMVAAKTDHAHHHLSNQISTRALKRKYLALCWGVIKPHSGTITGNIGRSPKNRKKMAVLTDGGKEATTHYKTIEVFADGTISLIECTLDTGRTHQIRVHMAQKGHPLVGDALYGSNRKATSKKLSIHTQEMIRSLGRQALHSYILGVENPSDNSYMEFRSELPDDIKLLINSLKLLNKD